MTVLEQPDIYGDTHTVAANGKPLTARQEAVWQLVRNTPGGVTPDEVGAAIHASQGRHPADLRCQWDASTGMDVLRSVALKPLVVRRRVSGRFEPRERQPAKPLPDLVEPSEAELAQNPFAGLS